MEGTKCEKLGSMLRKLHMLLRDTIIFAILCIARTVEILTVLVLPRTAEIVMSLDKLCSDL